MAKWRGSMRRTAGQGWRRFRAVLFDLHGTLVEDRDYEEFSHLAHQVDVPADPEPLSEAVRWADTEFDRARDRPTPVTYWQAVLARASGRAVGPVEARRYVERLDRLPPIARLFSDVRRTLERLTAEGRRLGVVSNSRSESSVREMLESVRILPYFSVIVSSGSEGVEKPDPEIFHRAVERIGVAPSEAFYVGDLSNTDARAAEAAGLASVWLHRDGTGFGLDPPEITSLSELPRWVAKLEGALVK